MKKENLYQRSNEEWMKILTCPTKDRVEMDLKNLLLPCLRLILAKTTSKDLKPKTEDFTRRTIITIQEELPTFNGNVKFTFWAMKIAIHQVFIDLRRERLKENYRGGQWSPVKIKSSSPAIPHFSDSDLELAQIQYSILNFIGDCIEKGLTDHQRTALIAIYQQGLSMEESALLLENSQNSLETLLSNTLVQIRESVKEQLNINVCDVFTSIKVSNNHNGNFLCQKTNLPNCRKEDKGFPYENLIGLPRVS